MKKLFCILLLFSFLCNAQSKYKPTDEDYHYHAGMFVSGLAGSTIYFFTGKNLLSNFLGSLIGTGIGIGKEEVYDRLLKMGTPSNMDKINTGRGSFTMCIYSTIYINHLEKRAAKIDTLQYQFLNQKP